jgi:hypothetical protein
VRKDRGGDDKRKETSSLSKTLLTRRRREKHRMTERAECCKRLDVFCATPACHPLSSPAKPLTQLGTSSTRTHIKIAMRFLSARVVRKDPSWTTGINTDDPAPYIYIYIHTPSYVPTPSTYTGTGIYYRGTSSYEGLVFYPPQMSTCSSPSTIFEI